MGKSCKIKKPTPRPSLEGADGELLTVPVFGTTSPVNVNGRVTPLSTMLAVPVNWPVAELKVVILSLAGLGLIGRVELNVGIVTLAVDAIVNGMFNSAARAAPRFPYSGLPTVGSP